MQHLRNKETNAFGDLVFNVVGKQAKAKVIFINCYFLIPAYDKNNLVSFFLNCLDMETKYKIL